MKIVKMQYFSRFSNQEYSEFNAIFQAGIKINDLFKSVFHKCTPSKVGHIVQLKDLALAGNNITKNNTN
jgi:hypothetical protein